MPTRRFNVDRVHKEEPRSTNVAERKSSYELLSLIEVYVLIATRAEEDVRQILGYASWKCIPDMPRLRMPVLFHLSKKKDAISLPADQRLKRALCIGNTDRGVLRKSKVLHGTTAC